MRGLENLVRRLLTNGRNADIRASDLPEEIRSQTPRRKLSLIEQVELETMTTALSRARGNKTQAAELMGISRATLYRKIRSFGIDLDRLAF